MGFRAWFLKPLTERMDKMAGDLEQDFSDLQGSVGTLAEDVRGYIDSHGDNTAELRQQLTDMTAARDALAAQLGDSNVQVQTLTDALAKSTDLVDRIDQAAQGLNQSVQTIDQTLKGTQPQPQP
jgi:methyl-accepting chemotaxis protein